MLAGVGGGEGHIVAFSVETFCKDSRFSVPIFRTLCLSVRKKDIFPSAAIGKRKQLLSKIGKKQIYGHLLTLRS